MIDGENPGPENSQNDGPVGTQNSVPCRESLWKYSQYVPQLWIRERQREAWAVEMVRQISPCTVHHPDDIPIGWYKPEQ